MSEIENINNDNSVDNVEIKVEENNSGVGKKNYPTSMMLFIRVFIGGYLMYLSYQLTTGGENSMNRAVSMAFVVLFSLAGIALIIISLKMMIKGEYQGGMADFDEEDLTETIEENKEENQE